MLPEDPIFYYRKLPHIQPFGYTFMLTWRLAGSLPAEVINKLKKERDAAIITAQEDSAIAAAHQAYLFALNDHLDQAQTGPVLLKETAIAQLITNKLHSFDRKYYHLICYSIMPNHVHALFDFSVQHPPDTEKIPEGYVQLSQVMKLIKGNTAFEANKILGKKGTFWARENYDRIIRNEIHLKESIRYILFNPIKAGICHDWTEHPFTWLTPEWVHRQ